MRVFVLSVCLFAMTACGGSGPTHPTAALNTEFTLAPGESRILEGVLLIVRFTGVTGDSRCPADAICIQGGSADVRITAVSDRATSTYALKTGDMRPVQHDSFTISLVQVSPYPFSSRTIAPEEYRATFRVTR
jgi:hypothetical protein